MSSITHERLLDLVGKIYDAAAEPERWAAFLESCADTFSSQGTILFLYDASSRRAVAVDNHLSFLRHVRFDPDYLANLEFFNRCNVWLPNAQKVPDGVPVRSSEMFPDTDLSKTEYYNEWLRPQGYFHAIGGSISQTGGLSVRLTCLRSKRQGPFTDAETQAWGALMPHLKRACTLSLKLSEAEAACQAGYDTLNRLAVGVILFDAKGKALFRNEAAETILRQADGLSVDKDGRCHGLTPAVTGELRRLMFEAAQASRNLGLSAGGVLALPRLRAEHPLSAVISPVSENFS